MSFEETRIGNFVFRFMGRPFSVPFTTPASGEVRGLAFVDSSSGRAEVRVSVRPADGDDWIELSVPPTPVAPTILSGRLSAALAAYESATLPSAPVAEELVAEHGSAEVEPETPAFTPVFCKPQVSCETITWVDPVSQVPHAVPVGVRYSDDTVFLVVVIDEPMPHSLFSRFQVPDGPDARERLLEMVTRYVARRRSMAPVFPVDVRICWEQMLEGTTHPLARVVLRAGRDTKHLANVTVARSEKWELVGWEGDAEGSRVLDEDVRLALGMLAGLGIGPLRIGLTVRGWASAFLGTCFLPTVVYAMIANKGVLGGPYTVIDDDDDEAAAFAAEQGVQAITRAQAGVEFLCPVHAGRKANRGSADAGGIPTGVEIPLVSADTPLHNLRGIEVGGEELMALVAERDALLAERYVRALIGHSIEQLTAASRFASSPSERPTVAMVTEAVARYALSAGTLPMTTLCAEWGGTLPQVVRVFTIGGFSWDPTATVTLPVGNAVPSTLANNFSQMDTLKVQGELNVTSPLLNTSHVGSAVLMSTPPNTASWGGVLSTVALSLGANITGRSRPSETRVFLPTGIIGEGLSPLLLAEAVSASRCLINTADGDTTLFTLSPLDAVVTKFGANSTQGKVNRIMDFRALYETTASGFNFPNAVSVNAGSSYVLYDTFNIPSIGPTTEVMDRYSCGAMNGPIEFTFEGNWNGVIQSGSAWNAFVEFTTPHVSSAGARTEATRLYPIPIYISSSGVPGEQSFATRFSISLLVMGIIARVRVVIKNNNGTAQNITVSSVVGGPMYKSLAPWGQVTRVQVDNLAAGSVVTSTVRVAGRVLPTTATAAVWRGNMTVGAFSPNFSTVNSLIQAAIAAGFPTIEMDHSPGGVEVRDTAFTKDGVDSLARLLHHGYGDGWFSDAWKWIKRLAKPALRAIAPALTAVPVVGPSLSSLAQAVSAEIGDAASTSRAAPGARTVAVVPRGNPHAALRPSFKGKTLNPSAAGRAVDFADALADSTAVVVRREMEAARLTALPDPLPLETFEDFMFRAQGEPLRPFDGCLVETYTLSWPTNDGNEATVYCIGPANAPAAAIQSFQMDGPYPYQGKHRYVRSHDPSVPDSLVSASAAGRMPVRGGKSRAVQFPIVVRDTAKGTTTHLASVKFGSQPESGVEYVATPEIAGRKMMVNSSNEDTHFAVMFTAYIGRVYGKECPRFCTISVPNDMQPEIVSGASMGAACIVAAYRPQHTSVTFTGAILNEDEAKCLFIDDAVLELKLRAAKCLVYVQDDAIAAKQCSRLGRPGPCLPQKELFTMSPSGFLTWVFYDSAGPSEAPAKPKLATKGAAAGAPPVGRKLGKSSPALVEALVTRSKASTSGAQRRNG
jgi:hypothetical protein